MAGPEMTLPACLTRGESGVVRIAGSRVTLDSLVYQFRQGATAEQIQEDFPSLALGDIYSTIAYYLHNAPSVEAYLRDQQAAAAQVRREIEDHQDAGELRQRLRQRRVEAAK